MPMEAFGELGEFDWNWARLLLTHPCQLAATACPMPYSNAMQLLMALSQSDRCNP